MERINSHTKKNIGTLEGYIGTRNHICINNIIRTLKVIKYIYTSDCFKNLKSVRFKNLKSDRFKSLKSDCFY